MLTPTESLAAQVRGAFEFGWQMSQDRWSLEQLRGVMRRAQPVIQVAAVAGWNAGSELPEHVKARAALFVAELAPVREKPR